MDSIAKTYNKTLKKLIDILQDEIPGNALIDSIQRKYVTYVSTDRTLLLTETGPELYRFREYIANEQWNELINMNWETEVQKNDVEESTSIISVIQLLRKIWNDYEEQEKKKITKYIKILLSEYSKYLAQC